MHSFETQWKSRHLPCSNGVRFFFQEIDGNKDGNIQDSEIVYFFNLFDANGIVFPMQLYLYVSEGNPSFDYTVNRMAMEMEKKSDILCM